MKLHAQIKRPAHVHEQIQHKKPEEHHEPLHSEAVKAARHFLRGERSCTEQVLIGLHKALIMRQLVRRVLVAHKAGAKLAAEVENFDKKSMRQLIIDPKFQWRHMRHLKSVP